MRVQNNIYNYDDIDTYTVCKYMVGPSSYPSIGFVNFHPVTLDKLTPESKSLVKELREDLRWDDWGRSWMLKMFLFAAFASSVQLSVLLEEADFIVDNSPTRL